MENTVNIKINGFLDVRLLRVLPSLKPARLARRRNPDPVLLKGDQ
jgi:hypothetical protein